MEIEKLKPVFIKKYRVNPKIIEALNRVERDYGVPREQLMISAGAAVSSLLAHKYFRPISDIDILINPDYAQSIPNLNPNHLDLRSSPWGLIYFNPIITIASDGVSPQIDLSSEMYHAHLPERKDDPLSGFVYRFPVKSAFVNPYKIRDVNIMRPEFIILYKLLQWRNGDYSGWDRTKRDAEDILVLMSNRLVSYDQVIKIICDHVPDETAKQVLVKRLNIALNSDDPTKIGICLPHLLASERQWDRLEISGQFKQVFVTFIKSGATCGWIKQSDKLEIIKCL